MNIPTVDLLLTMPDIICAAFVSETLLHLVTDRALQRILVRTGMRSEYAREILLHEFLKGDSEWVFLVDADMILPKSVLPRLLRHGKKMITGLYFARGDKGYPVIFHPDETADKWPKTRHYDYPVDGGLIEVGGCGHGCLLMHRSVLEAMEEPYSLLGEWHGRKIVGSDVRLCMKAREEAGVKIWCDTSVKCGHLRPMAIDEEYWLKNKEIYREEWMQRMQEGGFTE